MSNPVSMCVSAAAKELVEINDKPIYPRQLRKYHFEVGNLNPSRKQNILFWPMGIHKQ
jgi:hypothetical protein